MHPKKKVVFLTNWYPSNSSHKGIFIRNHALVINSISEVLVIDFQFLASRNFFSIEHNRVKDENDLDVFHVHIHSFAYKLIYYLIFIQKWVLKKVLSLHKINLKEYDFVVSNVLFPSGILGNWLKHMYQLKHIHIEHWSGARRFLSRNILRKKGVLALKETNQLVVVSELLEKELIAILQFKKIVVIPNVIGSQFKYLDKMQSSETFRFIAVANWRKPKNPFLFIKALQEIKKEDPNLNFELTLVGEGPQLQIIRKMDLNFPINYTGAVQNKSLANLFQSSNIFLHGSDFETFSIVSIEALMCGLPVIASKVGVLPSVINARNGILCDDTIDSWKEGIRKVLSTPYKNNEIAAQASANFSQRHIKDKFYDLFYNE